MKRTTLAAVLLACTALATPASAIPLTLVGAIADNSVGPQSTSNPCVIAGTTCQQPASMGYNNFTSTGAISAYNMYSTTPTDTLADGVQGSPYTVNQLLGAVGSAFVVAIDVNTTVARGETLNLFEVLVDVDGAGPGGYQVLYNYIGPTNIGNINNQGNGYADWTLNTVSLAGLPLDARVLFYASWSGATDGAESYFLVPVPGPLAGAGIPMTTAALSMFGLNFWRRRRNGANLPA
jgi:hypothetical protein